jgi:hypothetical protein
VGGKMSDNILKPTHPMWDYVFRNLSEKLEKTECNGDLSITETILKTIFDIDVYKTIKYFEENGGYCDCEVMKNVYKRSSLLFN